MQVSYKCLISLLHDSFKSSTSLLLVFLNVSYKSLTSLIHTRVLVQGSWVMDHGSWIKGHGLSVKGHGSCVMGHGVGSWGRGMGHGVGSMGHLQVHGLAQIASFCFIAYLVQKGYVRACVQLSDFVTS